MPASLEHRPSAQDAPPGERLDCWKEIASYLGRGERTVKRWEAERGLPIRRLPGGGRSSVYAFSAELDEWLKSSRPEELGLGPERPAYPSLEAVSAAAAEAGSVSGLVPAADSGIDPRTKAAGPASSAAATRAARTLRRRTWLLACAAVALLGLAAVSWHIFAARGVALTFVHWRLKLASSSTPRVSDEEKKVARDLYLRGRYEWNLRSPESLERALDAFTQAIVHDPGYAEAYVGLADTYDLLREYSRMPDSEAYSRATAAAKKAVELDDSLAEAHRALAFAEMYGGWDFRDAEKEFRRAIALNPNDPVAHRWYANAIAVPGRYKQSLEEMEKAQELDPTSHSTLADKGVLLFNSGKRREALALLEQVEQSVPEFQSPHKYRMRIAFETEDYPAYLSEGDTLAALNGDPVLKEEIDRARAGFARAGAHGLLEALYAKQREDYAAGRLWATILAQTCVRMGKKREAVQLLEEGYARHEEYVVASSLSDPVLRQLNDEPGYRKLLETIDFPSAPPAP